MTPWHQPSDQFEDGEDRLKLKLRLRVDQLCLMADDGLGTFVYPQTLKSTDRTQKHRDWWFTQFGCGKELRLCRRRSRIIASIILQPNRAPRLKNRWSSQLTASNIVFVLVHIFPFMPCFDIFNLLYSHLTPRPNHKCPSTLLKSF